MSNISDMLVEASYGDPVSLPLEINFHPMVVSENGTSLASYFSVDLAFDDEEAEDWVVDGAPIRGFGDTVEEAMEQFMATMHEFAVEVTGLYQKADDVSLSEDEGALLTMLEA